MIFLCHETQTNAWSPYFYFIVEMHAHLLIILSNLQKELQNMEEEHSKRARGFREVIELLSTSQKPIVAHNSLNGPFLFVLISFLH